MVIVDMPLTPMLVGLNDFVTVGGATIAASAAEISEVLPDGSVAVAVMFSPAATAAARLAEKAAAQPALVAALVEPRYVRACVPAPFEKNSIVYVVLATEFSVPVIRMFEPVVCADVSSGKFCRLLPPESGSQLSFVVGPSLWTPVALRSMPSAVVLPVLPKIELERILFE